MTTTHVRIDETLNDWMQKTRKPGDTPTDQIKKALQAQAQWDAGLTKKNVSADEADAAVERFQTLLEL